MKLIADEIDSDDFRMVKKECQDEIQKLEHKMTKLAKPKTPVESLLNKAVAKLTNLGKLYKEGTVIHKRNLLCSMFPEKMIFDGKNFRTPRVNEAVQLISTVAKGLREKKEGKICDFSLMSTQVTPQRLELWTR